MAINTEPTQPQTTERRSSKCPICCKSIAPCPHAKTLIENSGQPSPFIGYYNNTVYHDVNVPPHLLHVYDSFIIMKLDEFASRLTSQPISWEGYRGLLLVYFYDPIVKFAKEKGFVHSDFKLRWIKEEKKNNNLINLNNNLNNSFRDDPAVASAKPSTLRRTSNSVGVPKSNQTTSQQEPKPNYQQVKIKKASPRKQPSNNSTITTRCLFETLSSPPITQAVLVRDRANKQTRMMHLKLQDFYSTTTFQRALRRELLLDFNFSFDDLKFKHPEDNTHSIQVKECEMKVLSQYVREKKFSLLSFQFGRKVSLSTASSTSTSL